MIRVDETGVMNSYADEPRMYLAWNPTYNEQISYIRQGAAALLVVATLLVVAFGVS